MPNLLQQFIILVVFGLFALGLGCTAAAVMPKTRSGLTKTKTLISTQQSEGLRLLIALIIYSLLCNALLLIPALLQFLGLNQNWIPELHQLALGTCLALSLGLALIGLVSLLRCHWSVGSGLLKTLPFPAVTNQALLSLAISMGAYLVLVQLNAISYDFGLYHLPYVNHLVTYGPEPGLANLHSRFGFYNIQFFGQASWQLLTGQPTLISPSLNIIFFNCLLLHFIPAIKAELNQAKEAIWRPTGASSLILLTLALATGLPSFGSLANFDADFALTISSLIGIDLIYKNLAEQDPLMVALLVALLPLIKFSGVLALMAVFIFGTNIYVLKKIFKKGSQVNSTAISHRPNPLFLFNSRPHATGNVLAIIVAAWLCMAGTNAIQSGYPLYPNVAIGPIGSHAVAKAGVQNLLNRQVLDYARFNDNILGAPFSSKPSATQLAEWLPAFLRSDRGHQITTWVSAAAFASLIGVACTVFERYKDYPLRHSALSISTLATIILMILFLPPNPRFYSWLGVLAYFVALDILSKRPLPATFFALLVSSTIAARVHRPLLGQVGQPAHHRDALAVKSIHGWQPAQRQETIYINKPNQGDKCWGIPSPCSPYRAGIENPAAVDLLR